MSKQIDFRDHTLLATTDFYVAALHEDEALWRDYYQVSTALIGAVRSQDEPDGE